MDKDILISEYLKIYFSCHPEELPKDPEKAFELLGKLHKKYKSRFIDDFKANLEWLINTKNCAQHIFHQSASVLRKTNILRNMILITLQI